MRRLASLALILAQPAFGQSDASDGAIDPRLVTIVYDPGHVVPLAVADGYQVMVSFGAGERIETIAVGDSSAWQVTPGKRGDYLFIKSVQPGSNTNLTVVTDAHFYSFDLTRAAGSGGGMAYVVRFTYPDAGRPVMVATPTPAYHYRLSGARSIRPSKVEQDGSNVTVEWPADKALPAIYRIDSGGAETLVNGEMQGGRFVIAGTPIRLVFRLDRQIATAARVSIRPPRR